MNTVIQVDLSQIPDPTDESLTPEERQARLDDATAAMFAAVFNAPKVTGEKAKALVEARQAKAAGAALAALFATMGE